jgi:glycosyltransferase involved in cell wall biosynthesis
MTKQQSRAALGLCDEVRAVLFFGNISSYKGLEYALYAIQELRKTDQRYHLIIAGRQKGDPKYWAQITSIMDHPGLRAGLIPRIEYIPDEDVELYFEAADVLVLPYRFIYQSGVLFLSYSFGLPVIASDVGSLSNYVVEGRTGMVCRPEDAGDLAKTIGDYFGSDLYRNLDSRRPDIIEFANREYSWDEAGWKTHDVYRTLFGVSKSQGRSNSWPW